MASGSVSKVVVRFIIAVAYLLVSLFSLIILIVVAIHFLSFSMNWRLVQTDVHQMLIVFGLGMAFVLGAIWVAAITKVVEIDSEAKSDLQKIFLGSLLTGVVGAALASLHGHV